MRQEIYNKFSIVISILALMLSLTFPYIKEKYFDKSELTFTSGNKLILFQQYGNSELMLPVYIVNSGNRTGLVNRIECSLYTSDGKLLVNNLKPRNYIGERDEFTDENIIAIKPNDKVNSNISFLFNNELDEENQTRISKINNEAILDLINQGCIYSSVQNHNNLIYQITDSIYNKFINLSISNLESVKIGDYKILYKFYQSGEDKPIKIIGKSFSIKEFNKNELTIGLKNFKYGSHLYFRDGPLFSNSTSINSTDLNETEINQLNNKN